MTTRKVVTLTGIRTRIQRSAICSQGSIHPSLIGHYHWSAGHLTEAIPEHSSAEIMVIDGDERLVRHYTGEPLAAVAHAFLAHRARLTDRGLDGCNVDDTMFHDGLSVTVERWEC